uniref:Copia-type reverse transcriptase n=1 Tax=Solanum tuberosum TaxID=4113 RepID=M1A7P8_SOLTU
MIGFLQHKQDSPTKIFFDSKSAIALTKNSIFHGHSKHIDIKWHFIRDLVQDKEIMVEYCKTEEQVVDIFTKPLKLELFIKLKKMLGMVTFEDLGLREAM